MNKKITTSTFLLLTWLGMCAQVGISIDGSNPDPSAILDVKSTTRGFLLPRMTQTQRNDISFPAEGLMVYCTDCGISPPGVMTIFLNGTWHSLTCGCPVPLPVTTGTHTSTPFSITWNWNPVEGASGYLWNTTSSAGTATDLGANTSKTESELACNTAFSRYIWAYDSCGISLPVVLNKSTGACPPWSCGDPFTDNRDGQNYGTVLVGEKCWFAGNLNFGNLISSWTDQTNNGLSEKYCYLDNLENCSVYGGLYQWKEMMNYAGASNAVPGGCQGLCPSGWHVPSDAEWCQLEMYLDTSVSSSGIGWRGSTIGGQLKETGTAHWLPPNEGATNSSGFTALPGGNRLPGGNCNAINIHALFWTSAEYSATVASYRHISNIYSSSARDYVVKDYGFSVRCVKNCQAPATPGDTTQSTTQTMVKWSWKPVQYATGYKWSPVNDFFNATDLGTQTTRTEKGLNAGTPYTRYVWAYNSCGFSSALSLNTMTSENWKLCGQTVSDSRDFQEYNTVLIGNQCWFSRNLNTGVKISGTSQHDNNLLEKYCYNDLEANCDIYGGLYQWAEAVQYLNGASNSTSWNPVPTGDVTGICPAGWHIPTIAEMAVMENYLGSSIAGLALKEAGTVHWAAPNANASNSSGFTALPGGNRSVGFSNLTEWAFFWSTSGILNNTANYKRLVNVSDNFSTYGANKTDGYSVRCLKSCPEQIVPAGASHVPSVTQIVWKWHPVAGATGYRWNVNNNFETALDVGNDTSKTETGLTCNTSYTRYLWAYNGCLTSLPITLIQTTSEISLATPVAGTHIATLNQITWNWNSVPGATGYRWNTVNEYSTSTNIGLVTTKIETGLTCATDYTRYVWAYNACGHTLVAVTLSKNTLDCITCGQNFTDIRDGKSYSTVRIGLQCWFSKNMNVGTKIDGTLNQNHNNIIEKYCYNNLESNCDIYGGLYQWKEMMSYSPSNPGGTQGICPAGWHIPGEGEWNELTTFLGGMTTAGGALKESGYSHWYSPNTGATNTTGFTALPGGSRYNGNGTGFHYWRNDGYYWASVSSPDTANAVSRYFSNNSAAVVPLNIVKNDGLSVRCLADCHFTAAPSSGTQDSTFKQITWHWNTVPGAIGYKWNTVNNYNTALDMGMATSKVDTGLNCNTAYLRYVWSYNSCAFSTATTLTCSTSAICPYPCGQPITITHVAGDVSPVNKTVTYGTVSGIPGEPNVCWITSNLGADHQASEVGDGSEASAGWYWQFNRKQGFKHDGTSRTPGSIWEWWILESDNWSPDTDPCQILLGATWHIPTSTQWHNVDNIGNWTNWFGAFNSGLKLHAAGSLTNTYGNLIQRGIAGNYWGANGLSPIDGWKLLIKGNYSDEELDLKPAGNSIRCVNNCWLFPVPPTPSVCLPTQNKITWTWLAVPGASGYKWGTINNYDSATDMASYTVKIEDELSCDSLYVRYVWAYNGCVHSESKALAMFTTSCWKCGDLFSDERDDKEYQTVEIGDRCWFAQNLNIGEEIDEDEEQENNDEIEKYCYSGFLGDYCDDYGGLYQWDEMMNYVDSTNANPSGVQGICPVGWHIPSSEEWTELALFLNGKPVAGGKMKEKGTSHWKSPNVGATNSSKFTALPGGYMNDSIHEFEKEEKEAWFWSTHQPSTSATKAWAWPLYYNSAAFNPVIMNKADACSVRCVKDDEE